MIGVKVVSGPKEELTWQREGTVRFTRTMFAVTDGDDIK
jgi:hypothetical protein